MTVKHGHDCLGDASDVVPDALLSRETNLSSALVSLVGKIDGESFLRAPSQPITAPGRFAEQTQTLAEPLCCPSLFSTQSPSATALPHSNINAKPRRTARNTTSRSEAGCSSMRSFDTSKRSLQRRQGVSKCSWYLVVPSFVPSSSGTPCSIAKIASSRISLPISRPLSPIPSITNDTLAACVHGRSTNEWEVTFCHGDEPTRVATFVRWSEQGLLVIAAHEADPLVSASTKFGQICDVAFEPIRVVLVSADSDFFMLLGADQAR